MCMKCKGERIWISGYHSSFHCNKCLHGVTIWVSTFRAFSCGCKHHTQKRLDTCRKYHVMPREEQCGAQDSCFGLVVPHQQSIPQLLSLASQVYKGCHELSTCCFELMIFITTRHCHWYVLTLPRHSWFGA